MDMNGKHFVAWLIGLAVPSALLAATVTYDMNGSGGWSDGTRWVGGLVPYVGDTVEIPAGRAWVGDADRSILTNVIVNLADAGSVLCVTNAAAWNPAFKANSLRGGGTLEIDSLAANEIVFCTPLANFNGDIVVKHGRAVGIYTTQALGRNTALAGETTYANPPPGKVVICRGATLDVTGYGNVKSFPDFSLGFKEIHLSGNYASVQSAVYNPIGAISIEQWNAGTLTQAVANVVLDDDAWLSGHVGGNLGIGGASADNPGRLDLCGHDLYLSGNSGRAWTLFLSNALVTNSVPGQGGRIYVDSGGMKSAHTLQVGENVVFDRNVRIVLGTTGVLALDNAHDMEIAAQIEVNRDGPSIVFLKDGASDVTFAGDILGNGALTLDSSFAGKLRLGGDNSGFTGTIYLAGSGVGPTLVLERPEAMPSKSSYTVRGGTLVARMKNFTREQYLALVNAVSYANDSVGDGRLVSSVTMDPSGLPEDAMDFALASGEIANDEAAIGIGASGTVRMTALPADRRMRFAAWDGVLSFGCDGNVGEMLATGFSGGTGGEIRIDGVAIDMGTNALWIGASAPVGDAALGQVTVTNALVTRTTETEDMATYEGFEVGAFASGLLSIADSCVTNRLHVGIGAAGCGAALLRNSNFATWGSRNMSTAQNCLMLGYGGHGALEMDATELYSPTYAIFGYDGFGSGVAVQKGGRFMAGHPITGGVEDTPTQIYVGCHKGRTAGRVVGQWWLKDGAYACSSHQSFVAGIGSDGSVDKQTYGTLTIDGAGTTFHVGGPIGVGQSYDSTGIVNLKDGGTLRAKTFWGASSGRNGKSYVNFVGGTYEYTGWGATRLFGISPDADNELDRSMTRVTVYAGGGAIELSSSQKDRMVGQPIHGATGRGIVSIPWADSEKVFVGAPAVVIEGDGIGASAMANYDPDTRTVSGFTVTSPGCDYTMATAYVLQGPVTNAVIDLSNALAENAPDGGMTFRHTNTGSLVFDVANTYTGPTVLDSVHASAIFAITNKDAFATSSSIALKGNAKLYVGEYTLADLTAPFRFMGGTVTGELPRYAIPEGKLVVDANDILSGEANTLAGNGNITLPSSVTLLNGERLREAFASDPSKRRFKLLELHSKDIDTPLAVHGVPDGWHVSRIGTTLRLARSGSMVILR